MRHAREFPYSARLGSLAQERNPYPENPILAIHLLSVPAEDLGLPESVIKSNSGYLTVLTLCYSRPKTLHEDATQRGLRERLEVENFPVSVRASAAGVQTIALFGYTLSSVCSTRFLALKYSYRRRAFR
jgi:hypothetical protein